MRNSNKFRMGAFVLSLASMSNLAHAEGWYAGVGAGQSTFKDWNSQSQSAGFNSASETDTAYNLFAGYQFNPNLGVEGGYLDLGKATADFSSGLGTAHDEFKASGFTAAAVGTLPINDSIGLFAKAGLFLWEAKNTSTATGSVTLVNPDGSTTQSYNQKSTGVSPLFGVGANFNATQNIAIRLGYDIFSSVGDNNKTGQGDIDLLSVSAVYRF